ncbi:hypothetical protein ACQEVG_37365 [Streptomyces sp. CA-135486]|uniref:hypothetical protein n=1 Tax=Streptomyces sp. CA-135486 TaxID=3240049 RepID=UPI003D8DD593
MCIQDVGERFVNTDVLQGPDDDVAVGAALDGIGEQTQRGGRCRGEEGEFTGVARAVGDARRSPRRPSSTCPRSAGLTKVLGTGLAEGLDELDVDLQLVAGALLLVALPAGGAALLALGGRSRLRPTFFRMRQTPDELTLTSW